MTLPRRPTPNSPPLTAAEKVRIILASGSPRRREFLTGLELPFDVRPADIDETPIAGETPGTYVARLCAAKATHVAAQVGSHDTVVIAADTTVTFDGKILEKPLDDTDGVRMLRALSGRTHETLSGIAVCVGGVTKHKVVTTEVEFAELSDADVAWYVGTGEGRDKAGGYGLQGRASVFIRRLNGSVSNVIGLPLAELVDLLREFDLSLDSLRSSSSQL
jgi:septum formation protein